MLRKFLLEWFGDAGHRRELTHALMINPVPELFSAKRLFAERFKFRQQFGAREANQVPPSVRQDMRRWREVRRLGQNAFAFGVCQVKGYGHARTIAS